MEALFLKMHLRNLPEPLGDKTSLGYLRPFVFGNTIMMIACVFLLQTLC